ncbi:MAG TPA: XdhC/CoxI family protein [Thermoanaerobaculia bacterium]|nr:XdhC/CoxI family protein [Thermoanaerobaculia bacterium]
MTERSPSSLPSEPVTESPARVLGRAEEAVARHGRIALAQIVRAQGSTPGKAGWKLVVTPDGAAHGNLGGGAFEAMVVADARAKLAARRPEGEVKRYYLTEDAVRGEPTGMVCGGMVEVFLEVVAAPPVLLVCGGGPVGQALARAGDLAGFDLVMADDRPEFRRPELFPVGTRTPEVDRAFGGDLLAEVPGREVYAAVVTRCWETDTAALAAILRRPPERLAYLGLMGSRRKVARVKAELAARGLDLAGVQLHAPIGLPVGGDSPGEIAISIIAEVLQVRHAVD